MSEDTGDLLNEDKHGKDNVEKTKTTIVNSVNEQMNDEKESSIDQAEASKETFQEVVKHDAEILTMDKPNPNGIKVGELEYPEDSKPLPESDEVKELAKDVEELTDSLIENPEAETDPKRLAEIQAKTKQLVEERKKKMAERQDPAPQPFDREAIAKIAEGVRQLYVDSSVKTAGEPVPEFNNPKERAADKRTHTVLITAKSFFVAIEEPANATPEEATKTYGFAHPGSVLDLPQSGQKIHMQFGKAPMAGRNGATDIEILESLADRLRVFLTPSELQVHRDSFQTVMDALTANGYNIAEADVIGDQCRIAVEHPHRNPQTEKVVELLDQAVMILNQRQLLREKAGTRFTQKP